MFCITGVFTAAFEDQIEWLIVKGIADYADGDESTTERWSAVASVMAASVVQHVLSNPDVFSAWPNYCSEGNEKHVCLCMFRRELKNHYNGLSSSF